MAVITPGVAGPYDLGTVVVRVALNVNPETGSDQRGLRPDPERVRRGQAGCPLDRRQRQPQASSCSTRRIAKPGRRAARSTVAARTRPTRPRSAPTRQRALPGDRMQQAGLQAEAVHAARPGRPSGPRTRRSGRSWKHAQGDANLSRAALTLPHSLFLDQSHIKTVCTRVQLAAQDLPEGLGLRPGGSEVAAARQQVEGPGLPGLLQRQVAEPGGRPPRSGEHPAARRHQLQAGRSQDRLPDGAGRAR